MSENQYADHTGYRPRPTSNTTLWLTAIGVALAVVMLLAIVMPRVTGSGAVNWTVTLLAGLVAGAVAFGIAYAKRGSGEQESVSE